MLKQGLACLVTAVCAVAPTAVSASPGPSRAVQGSAAVTRVVADRFEDLPVGAPMSLPWSQSGVLHVDGAAVATPYKDITSRGTTTLVGRAPGTVLSRWKRAVPGGLKALPMLAPARKPLISANGRWIAWLEVDAPRTQDYTRIERYRGVLFDSAKRRVVNTFRDRRLVEWEDGINSDYLHTLSNRGVVVLGRGAQLQAWSRRGEPRDLKTPRRYEMAQFTDGWPGGTTLARRSGESGLIGAVSGSGRFHRAAALQQVLGGLWSPDGSQYAFSDARSRIPQYFIDRPLEGARVQLELPVDQGGYSIVGWDSPGSVVLWQSDPYDAEPTSRLVRCFAATASCQQVPGGPTPGTPATMSSRY